MSCLVAVCFAAGWVSAAALITIDNTKPRRDTHGNILNAHDGEIFHAEGKYWMVGTSYTMCNMNHTTQCNLQPISPAFNPNAPSCGFTNNDYAMYSSPDLMSWTLENPSLLLADQRLNGIYFRPKVIYNPRTTMYVLWFNYMTVGRWGAPSSWGPVDARECHGLYGTAVSPTPAGPYKIAEFPVRMGSTGFVHGDFGVMVDTDGTGYIAYNTYDRNYSVSVDKLTPDFTGSTRMNSGYFIDHHEAPVMMRLTTGTMAGKVAVLSGHLCCFCAEGSNLHVFLADHPLGPYTAYHNTSGALYNMNPAMATQQSFILPIPNSQTILWGGDRWQTAPYKAQDWQVWVPLTFDPVTGVPEPLRNVSVWTIP